MIKLRISKFFLVGIFNTSLNFLFIYILTGLAGINVIISSSVSFLLVNLLSYFINSFFVFDQALKIHLYFRFLIASLLSFVITLAVNSFFYFLDLHYLLATLFCIFIIPLFTFFTHQKWTWKN